uniref:Uncharacterized protein n=1 Tax=Roseihalotalea indica TaxID=2867963 RepID=A0AA49GJI5_9BACT|nr:hypothetical protein K4G66_23640 [Tunicatimonas sp. TK19036]
MKYVVLALIGFFCSASYAQTINREWNGELEGEIQQFKNCDNTSKIGLNSCHAFIGKTLKTVYRVNDFYSKDKNRYMVVSEIYSYLENSKQWTLLGKGYEQEALEKAQKLANQNKAVVAVYLTDAGIGHLAYILPGQLQPSGSWGFKVPNSAAYFSSEPEKSYMNKGLSYSFPRSVITKVQLYARNY